jgi:hypothetical protein
LLKSSAVYLIGNPEICQDPPSWGQDDQTLLCYENENFHFMKNFTLNIDEINDFLKFWPLMAFFGLHWPF